jgi:hypothetical protein
MHLRRGVKHPLPSSAPVKERIELDHYSPSVPSCTVTSTFKLTQPPSFTLRYKKYIKDRLHWFLKHTGLIRPAAPFCERAHETSGSTKIGKFLGELNCYEFLK